MIRAFVALQASTTLQRALSTIRRVCQDLPLALRWVSPENLHLTLKFLGEVTEQHLQTVVYAMQSIAADHTPFSLSARGLGSFPTPTKPRVFWMGLEDPNHRLATLQQQLDTALAAQVFPPEAKAFHPHLTLARIRKPTRCPQFQELLQLYREQYFGDMPIDTLHLLQSQLHREGAIYTVVCSVPLQYTAPPLDSKAHNHE